MATFSMDMPPALSGQNADTQALRSYVARLVDRLLYCLNHIDSENLVEGGIGIGKIQGGSGAIAAAAAQEMSSAQQGASSVSHLTAQVAEIVTAVIRHAVIDWANLKHVTAEDAIVANFVGDDMYISRLKVTAAQVVELTVGQLVIKASDGNYYRLDVDMVNQTVTAHRVTVTAGEIEAGATESGQHIIETTLTVGELSAQSIKAAEALIEKIRAYTIDTDKLLARQAVIDKLTTGEIAVALGNSLNLEDNPTVGTIKASLNGLETTVADLNGLQTHFIITPEKIRITQDQTQTCEMQLTAQDMRFVNTAGTAMAVFGVTGATVDRVRSNKELSVGTESTGWYDMTASATGIVDKWRNGTQTLTPAVITAEPEDSRATSATGTYSFTVTAEDAVSFQWYYRRRPADTWTEITGETYTSLLGTCSAEKLGWEYACGVTGRDGVEHYTRAARIRIDGGPVVVQEPTSTASLPVCVGAGALTRKWQYREGNEPDGSWTDNQTAAGTRYVRCHVTDGNGKVAVSHEFVEASA